MFKGRDGRVLYVGKSRNLRGRVKSYFYDAWLLAEGTVVLRDAEGNRLVIAGGSLQREDGEAPVAFPCPRERTDEVAAVRSYLTRNAVRLEETSVPLAEPVDGGAAVHRLLSRLRAAQRREPEADG